MFTLESTLILGLAIVISFYLSFYFFKKLKVKIDKELFNTILPWVILAAVIRVLEDARYFPDTPLLKTPLIELLFLSVFLTAFLILRENELMKIIPLATATVFFTQMPTRNFLGFSEIIAAWTLTSAIIYSLPKISKLQKHAVNFQLYDGWATAIAIIHGYNEQHLLPSHLINSFGPFSFLFLKLIIGVLIVALIKEKDDLSNYLLITIAVLGAAPGLRDALRLLAGV